MPDEFQNFLLDITSLTQFVNFKSSRFWNKNKISEYASKIATKKSFQQQNGRKILELGDVNTEFYAQRVEFYTFISMGYGHRPYTALWLWLTSASMVINWLFPYYLLIGKKTVLRLRNNQVKFLVCN